MGRRALRWLVLVVGDQALDLLLQRLGKSGDLGREPFGKLREVLLRGSELAQAPLGGYALKKGFEERKIRRDREHLRQGVGEMRIPLFVGGPLEQPVLDDVDESPENLCVV